MHAPGRSGRLNEAPINKMNELIEKLLNEIPNFLNKPYAFFGHSLGSQVGFELTCRLSELKLRLPIHFIASGSSGPQKKRMK